MGKGSSPPAAPNFGEIASQQAQLGQQAQTAQNYANRPNQNTPWGMMNWDTSQGVDPATGQPITQWQQNQSLNPQLQNTLQRQFNVGGDRSYMADVLAGRLGQSQNFGSPIDYSQFQNVSNIGNLGGVGALNAPNLGISDLSIPDEIKVGNRSRQAAEDAAYGRMTSRLDPRFDESQEALDVQMRNRGLRAGDQAYESEMDRFNRGKTDAYQAAMNEAVGQGRVEHDMRFNQLLRGSGQNFNQQLQAAGQNFNQRLQGSGQNFNQQLASQNQQLASQRQQMMQRGQQMDLRNQQISELLRQRQQPLQDINQLLYGQGVQSPQYGNFMNAGRAPTANLMGAANQQYGASADAYNAQQQQRQSTLGGLFGIAGSALGGPMGGMLGSQIGKSFG